MAKTMNPAMHMLTLTRGRSAGRVAVAFLFFALLAQSSAAWAVKRTFVARSDKTQVALDDSFVFEVTLMIDGGKATGYRAPSLKDFRVLSERPSESHQVSMGSGGMFQQVVYTWTYQLAPLRQGNFTIGGASVKVDGAALSTQPLAITVGDATGRGPQASPGQRPRRGPFGLSLGGPPRAPQANNGPSHNKLLATVSKDKVYLGEQISATWKLAVTDRPDNYRNIAEPKADGFWSEDLPIAANQRGLSLEQEEINGRVYLVGTLFRKALFPLRTGTLNITPLQAEISQVDFFGSTLRSEKLETAPTTIEVLPLPRDGRPNGFSDAAVGRFEVKAAVDRNRVSVGDAVTLTVVFRGAGNVRNLPVPTLDKDTLQGWKSYDPKTEVNVVAGDPIVGEKRIEFLLLAEKPGRFTFPAVHLDYFDPEAVQYKRASSQAFEVQVEVDPGKDKHDDKAQSVGIVSPTANGKGMENIIAGDLRPIHGRGELRRDMGAAFYRSRFFLAFVLGLPLCFVGAIVVDGVRSKWGQETERGRSRKNQRAVRQRLGRAQKLMKAGDKGGFYIEVDRALAVSLSARLDQSVAGLSREELSQRLLAGGLNDEVRKDILGALEQCDQARFAPGSVNDDEMSAALARAEELIVQIEKVGRRGAGPS